MKTIVFTPKLELYVNEIINWCSDTYGTNVWFDTYGLTSPSEECNGPRVTLKLNSYNVTLIFLEDDDYTLFALYWL